MNLLHSQSNRFGRALLLALCAACALPAVGMSNEASGVQTTQSELGAGTAGEFAGYGDWVAVETFIDMMVIKHGYTRPELESLFNDVRYVETAVQLIKPAPITQPKNWQAYRARFVEPVRIAAGAAFWNNYAEALAREEHDFGVPAEIIVGILGVETMFGRNVGSFRVMDVLTTLAFAYPDTPTRAARMTYFRSELENALLFARESSIDPLTLRGSYAGAIGWPQFMPGSIRQYAVDYDGDGKIDLRNSPVDAIGSVGNFLFQHGWRRGEPTVFPATVTTVTVTNDQPEAWQAFIGQGLAAKFTLDELKAGGVHPLIEPPADMRYGLVDLQNGSDPTEYWLGANNFFTITQYNRSYFYAMAVLDLSRAVRSLRSSELGDLPAK